MSLVIWLRRRIGYASFVTIVTVVALRLVYQSPYDVNRTVAREFRTPEPMVPRKNLNKPTKSTKDGYLEPNEGNRILFKSESDFGDPVETRPNLNPVSKNKKTLNFLSIDPDLFRNKTYSKGSKTVFTLWKTSSLDLCEGKLVAFDHEFALLKDAVIDRDFVVSSKKGGEFLDEVRMQNEDIEYVKFKRGVFKINCDRSAKKYSFNSKNHLNKYMSSVSNVVEQVGNGHKKDFAIAVTRYEYANLYHTMTDWYNAFLMMEYFNKTAQETNIILFDAHPRGVLDSVWPVLFNSTRRINRLPQRSQYKDLVWSIQGYNSFMLQHQKKKLPLVEEFRSFMLASFGIPPDKSVLDCDNIRVLFVWRRDYVAHPRRPDGHVVRKIHNERELLTYLQSKYKKLQVSGVQIDQFDMVDQLRKISTTDILVGMHGAGLTHALFIPKHGGLIELFPTYWSSNNAHFKSISSWRNLSYVSWENRDLSLEKSNHFTQVPVHIMDNLVQKVYQQICHSTLQ